MWMCVYGCLSLYVSPVMSFEPPWQQRALLYIKFHILSTDKLYWVFEYLLNSNTRFVTLKIVFLNKTEPRQTGQMLWNLVCDGNYFLTDLSCRWKELCWSSLIEMWVNNKHYLLQTMVVQFFILLIAQVYNNILSEKM